MSAIFPRLAIHSYASSVTEYERLTPQVQPKALLENIGTPERKEHS